MADPTIPRLPGPIPSAVVEVVDDMPLDPPWWKDPWRLGLVAVAGVLVLTILIPRRD